MTALDDLLRRCEAITADADAADGLLSDHATDPRAPFMLISTKDARTLARALKAVCEEIEASIRVHGHSAIRAAIERRLSRKDEP